MKRDLSLDSLRGLFLVFMMIAHFVWFGRFRSPVLLVISKTLGEVTAADGFFFLSGLVAGIVYSGPKLAGRAIWTTALKRAWKVYAMHIAVLSLVYLWYFFIADYRGDRLLAQHLLNFTLDPLPAWLSALVLLNQPRYHDILTLYVLFTLMIPFVIRGLQRGLWPLVVAVSFGVWLAAQFVTQQAAAPVLELFSERLRPNLGTFDFFAYQALYVAGLILGFRRRQGHRLPFHWGLVALSALVVGLFLLRRWDAYLETDIVPASWVSWLDFRRDIERTNFPWLRAINFAAAAYLIGCVARFRPKWVQSELLILLGQNAMLVFAWHVLVLFITKEPVQAAYRAGFWQYHLLMFFFVLSSVFPALVQREWRKRGRAKTATPA